MRIAVATWSSRLVGGTETYLARIMPLLAQAGCEIAFASETAEPETRPPIPIPDGIVVLPIARDPNDRLAALRAWRPDVVFAHGFLDPILEEELQGVAPSVFFAHSYYGTCISGDKTHRLPIARPCTRVLGPACLGLYYPRRCGGLNPRTLIDDYTRQTRRLALLQRYAAIVTASDHMRQEYLRHGIAEGRIFNCSFPRMDDDMPPTRDRVSRETTQPWRLTFAGRMEHLKGGGHLLAALPRVHDAIAQEIVLTMAGDGPARAAWQRHAAAVAQTEPAIRIEFTGWLDRRRLAGVLHESDMLVMPSLWPEPFGLTGIEANRAGVPVVAYATGGIPEWLSEGVNGCLAPADPPTVAGLADAIVRCMHELSSGEPLGANARQAAEARSTQAHVTALMNVLRDAAAMAVAGGGQRA